MARTIRQRRGIIRFLGNIVDDTKDMVDDMLDRARDVEQDLRSTAREALDTDDEDDEEPAADIASLQAALAELSAKVDQLAALRKAADETPRRSGSDEPVPAQP
ncbi:hypothetical protein SAMN05216188_10834 [Lentzea xinjiangensis]|uniref:Uncharacterized protein n=2 Tax=Lentzea xinjiangensis TaxID=402600 RepID=A0A1H9LP83_9PSEU|nr:hypothetical protein SAMN05216188_10834 [Lentzea xinjiangensis]